MKKSSLIILVLLLTTNFVFSQEVIKSVRAVKTKSPKIDGIFENSEWLYGGKATGFTQQEPLEGVPASQETEVYFLYDEDNLYVGVKCLDLLKEEIMSELSGRDNTGASDFISISIDTYNDHRNGYFFGATPGGTKIDGRYYNDGVKDNNWDGVWWVKTNLTDYGWIAEFKIPFSTLKFADKPENIWGLNISRMIQRYRETSWWQEMTRDDQLKVSKFGHLEGLEGIKPGMNLEILPYATNRLQKTRVTSFGANNENGITGIDIKYGVTSNLNAVLTVNPDFAQIEADEDIINLGRYPVFLREKRPFFIEGSSNFNTASNPGHRGYMGGGGGGSWGRGGSNMLFYSRRINEPVYGLKIAGKIGSWNIGLLHSLNDNDIVLSTRVEEGELPENTKLKSFFSILRLSKDVLSRSQIGFIAISKEYDAGHNRILGFDGQFMFKEKYTFSIEGVKSFSDISNEKNHSFYANMSRESDLLTLSAQFNEQAP
ncbi:DUF5916 domain-containing protein, partial [candidate division KSB1 bacterium]